MKIPELQTGDILLFHPGSEYKDELFMILTNPTILPGETGKNKIISMKFLYGEKIGSKKVELCVILSCCDIFRKGEKIWTHVPISNNIKFTQLRKLLEHKE